MSLQNIISLLTNSPNLLYTLKEIDIHLKNKDYSSLRLVYENLKKNKLFLDNIFLQQQLNILIDELDNITKCSEYHKIINLVVVGRSGVGKSSLCNFILNDHYYDDYLQNYHDKYEEDTNLNYFLIGDGGNSKTKKSSLKSLFKEIIINNTSTKLKINIIDTPGLFDSNNDDYTNIKDFYLFLNKIGYINYCVFCDKYNERMNDTQIKTYDFFIKLFSNIIIKKQFDYVSTQIGISNYKKSESKGLIYGSNIENFKELLSNNKLPTDNINPNYCDSDVYDNLNLYNLSKKYRENLLNNVLVSDKILVNSFSYYLTPDLDQIRIQFIIQINELLKIYKNNILNINKDLEDNVKYVDEKKLKIQSLCSSINSLDEEIKRINVPIVFSKIKYTSDDFPLRYRSFDINLNFDQEIEPACWI